MPSVQALEAAGSEEAGDGGLGWTIPPIRWGGSLGYGLRRSSNSDGLTSLDNVFNANLRGASYIYAPWLAQVSGTVGLVSGLNNYSGGDSGQATQTRNTSLVGNGNLDIFPSSRFPFSASLSRSDSRTASTALASDYTDTRLGLRQNYHSEDGLLHLSTGFDHSVISQSTSNDTVSALYGNLSAPFGPVNNSMNGRVSVSQREGTGEGSRLLAFSSSHSYSPQENVSLQAYSNYTDNDLRYAQGAGSSATQYRGQYLQAGTSASWQPEFEDEEGYPLNLTAGVNYSALKTQTAGTASQSQFVSGNTSAYYRFSPNLSVNGSGTMNYVSSATGQSQLFALLNSSITYSGDPLTIGNFSYNWNTGGNASWQGASGNSASNILTSLHAGHSLGRNIILSGTDSIYLTLSQNLTGYQNQQFGSSSTLNHGAMTSYRLGLGERFNGTVTGSFSDVMTSGVNAQHYQSLSLGFNGVGQLSQRSSASVNLMLNWSDQTQKNAADSFGQQGAMQQNGTQQNNTQRMNLTGNASYTHMRFATIPGLRYTFLFTADSLLRDDRLLGDANAQAQRYRYSADNRLEYRIGLLDLRLSGMVAETGGKKNALLFFQVTRQLGAY